MPDQFLDDEVTVIGFYRLYWRCVQRSLKDWVILAACGTAGEQHYLLSFSLVAPIFLGSFLFFCSYIGYLIINLLLQWIVPPYIILNRRLRAAADRFDLRMNAVVNSFFINRLTFEHSCPGTLRFSWSLYPLPRMGCGLHVPGHDSCTCFPIRA